MLWNGSSYKNMFLKEEMIKKENITFMFLIELQLRRHETLHIVFQYHHRRIDY